MKSLLYLLKKGSMPFLVIALFVSNGLTLFNANFYDRLFSALSFAPLAWKKSSIHQRLSNKNNHLKRLKTNSKAITKRIAKRTVRNVSANVAALTGEVVPVVGSAIVLSITAMDVYDACQDMKDLAELQDLLSFNEIEEDTHKVCGLKL